MYDLIGDIHGYADHLTRLLAKLGYHERQGLWQHPERKVIFLGDFVDRGPAQVEVVAIARAMIEQGEALAVMGNHEFNAVAWATPDPERPGQFMRKHSTSNRLQHEAFLEQVGEGSSLHLDMIEWFKTLPLYLDLPELRAVHACWHPPSLERLTPYLDSAQRILPSAWPALADPGTVPGEALETVLKGLEMPLPNGAYFYDKQGIKRHRVRTRWWLPANTSYREVAMNPANSLEKLPQELPDEPVGPDMLPGYDGLKPLFLGHYWLSQAMPEPLTQHIACLDYSVAARHLDKAGKHSKLCAYRWQGEKELTPKHFEWVS